MPEKIKYLVADTTAFINAVPLNDYAENILTVPDVVAEVKNKRQIRRLCVLPFDLKVQEPKAENLAYCVEYAKKTGDYASLSAIDIKVIALTYELEKENVGTAHLRNAPIMPKIVSSKDKPEEFKDDTKLPGWYKPNNSEKSDEEDGDDEDECVESDGSDEQKQADADIDDLDGNDNEEAMEDISQEQLDQLFQKLECEGENSDVNCDILVAENRNKEETGEDTDNESVSGSETANDNVAHSTNDADLEDDGWITPGNIKKAKKTLEGKVEDDIVPLVACMSTDFAIQNVLKQMNLQIAALNGRVIKNMRTYILRCYACFKTTSIMTKVFCPNCGNKTLKRVAVSLDENGKQVIHINTRRPLTAKYKNQSLPRFHGGKHSRNPILFEDQPIPRQMPSRVAKTKTNALDEDYIAGFSPFALRDVDSKSAMLRSKGNLKEWARNNTFEEDRRKKYYNRTYK